MADLGDEEIDRLVIGVRADTTGFARDIDLMRQSLEGGLGQGADKAGKSVETSLVRAATNGKLSFDTLRTTALGALEQIEASALKLGLSAIVGGGSAATGGLGTTIGSLLGGLVGLPGRATGGPVSPGSAYIVGERGPELFVPTSSGSIAAPAAGGGARDVRVAITVNTGGGDSAGALQQSSRQIARAVKAALDG